MEEITTVTKSTTTVPTRPNTSGSMVGHSISLRFLALRPLGKMVFSIFSFSLYVNARHEEGRDANPDLGLDPGPVVPPMHCPCGKQ